MNKLFGIVFLITFLLLSTDNFWGWAFLGVIALLLIVPFTTPEKIGEKKSKKLSNHRRVMLDIVGGSGLGPVDNSVDNFLRCLRSDPRHARDVKLIEIHRKN